MPLEAPVTRIFFPCKIFMRKLRLKFPSKIK
jgi:hypothetical protein